jgi:hypothetical protein
MRGDRDDLDPIDEIWCNRQPTEGIQRRPVSCNSWFFIENMDRGDWKTQKSRDGKSPVDPFDRYL